MQSPRVKKGDKVIVKKSNNGLNGTWIGKVLEVVRGTDNMTTGTVVVTQTDVPGAGNATLYYRGPGDEFVLATREAQADYCEERAKELTQSIERTREEIQECIEDAKRLRKYKSDEAYTAHKLEKILKNPNAKSIEKVLRELKNSDFL